jgi:plastocyanin
MVRFRFLVVFAILVFVSDAWSANWQVGRIQQVKKDVSSKTLYYIVNTPVAEDVVTYTISVHVDKQLVTGYYELDKVQTAPPDDWSENAPVWVEVEDKTLYLKSATSPEFKLAISGNKPAPMMQPLTLEEIKLLNAGAQMGPGRSTVGFGAKEAAQAREAATTKPTPEQPGGTLNVSTVPYLADIFVDGKDMGYSPAKIRMSPGKHVVRVSKNGYRSFTKEVLVAVDTDQKLDVTLEKKP